MKLCVCAYSVFIISWLCGTCFWTYHIFLLDGEHAWSVASVVTIAHPYTCDRSIVCSACVVQNSRMLLRNEADNKNVENKNSSATCLSFVRGKIRWNLLWFLLSPIDYDVNLIHIYKLYITNRICCCCPACHTSAGVRVCMLTVSPQRTSHQPAVHLTNLYQFSVHFENRIIYFFCFLFLCLQAHTHTCAHTPVHSAHA